MAGRDERHDDGDAGEAEQAAHDVGGVGAVAVDPPAPEEREDDEHAAVTRVTDCAIIVSGRETSSIARTCMRRTWSGQVRGGRGHVAGPRREAEFGDGSWAANQDEAKKFSGHYFLSLDFSAFIKTRSSPP
jgi:hypothetical protein